mmetsp:Transcript_18820/g.40524  ORF Transcript_18820/g.40524 Transcript_18820/m.40524 type:complete len:346 (+) Transcript_18820:109-1146(+)
MIRTTQAAQPSQALAYWSEFAVFTAHVLAHAAAVGVCAAGRSTFSWRRPVRWLGKRNLRCVASVLSTLSKLASGVPNNDDTSATALSPPHVLPCTPACSYNSCHTNFVYEEADDEDVTTPIQQTLTSIGSDYDYRSARENPFFEDEDGPESHSSSSSSGDICHASSDSCSPLIHDYSDADAITILCRTTPSSSHNLATSRHVHVSSTPIRVAWKPMQPLPARSAPVDEAHGRPSPVSPAAGPKADSSPVRQHQQPTPSPSTPPPILRASKGLPHLPSRRPSRPKPRSSHSSSSPAAASPWVPTSAPRSSSTRDVAPKPTAAAAAGVKAKAQVDAAPGRGIPAWRV